MEDHMLSPEKWRDFWRYYKGTPEQVEAVNELYVGIHSSDPCLLHDNASWVRAYRERPALGTLTPDAPFSTQITENFTYGEFALEQEARRFVNQGQCDIAVEIAQFLEKGRAKFGPLRITSGHRPAAINAACGGAINSEHLFQIGCGAVDAYPLNASCQDFENWCDKEWPFSIGYGASYRGFVHIGIRSGRPRVRWDY